MCKTKGFRHAGQHSLGNRGGTGMICIRSSQNPQNPLRIMCGPPPDHFSRVAEHYAHARPTYPLALFEWLALQSRTRDLAWDVGAGNGQASMGLARHFDHVVATDLSEEQLDRAPSHERVTYRTCEAHDSGLDNASVSLVTVAQALHWFDVDRFHAEARRVLRRGGLIAEWSYGTFSAEDERVDRVLQQFYHDVVGPYWPAERRHVETGYRDLPFPFRTVRTPSFRMDRRWTLPMMEAYLRSWSATGRMQQATGTDPLEVIESDLARAWGDPVHPLLISWPLALRVGIR